MKAKSRTIKCSVVLDYMGCNEATPEDEFEQICKDVREIIANPIMFYESKMVHRIEMGSDLVLFDFGGIMPGSNLMEDQSRELIQWAQDHPSALVLVISGFTFTHQVQPLMNELKMNVPNIALWRGYADTFPDWPGITRRCN